MRLQRSTLSHRVLLGLSVVVLFITTVYWATLGAIVHNNNADQLIDPLLFSSLNTFQQATFPAAHTFLIKWPIFALIAQFNNIPFAVIIATVILCIITVGGLLYIMYRIEKRPLVLAILSLFLTSVLLMIPAEPSPGALLPTNFAMLTTRNIEYVFFALGILLLFKGKKNLIIWALGLFTLLFASDRLFMYIGLGTNVLALVTYVLFRRRHNAIVAGRGLIVIAAAAVLSYGLLGLINALGLTHISTDAGAPYQLNNSAKDQIQAIVYAILGIATNFGANPLYDLNSWKDILTILGQRLSNPASIVYVVNAVGVAFVAVSSLKLFHLPKKQQSRSKINYDGSEARLFSLYFLAAGIVATILFIATSHYYPVDARYLTIWLYAGFVLAATSSFFLWKNASIKSWVWLVLVISVLFGIHSTNVQYQASIRAYSKNHESNDTVRAALDQHPVKTLIGDYWRTVPIVATMPTKMALQPLDTCFGPRTALTSSAWSNNPTSHSFAYLLTTKKTGTGFPNCSLQDIQDAYGVASRKVIISGQLPDPDEILLLYYYGIRPNTKGKPAVIVRNMETLDSVPCPRGTIMQIVAHQDDDILFMNPDLLNSLKQGDCVRTIYLTAGDHGDQKKYWISREDGVMAAYAKALNVPDPHWNISPYQVGDNQFVQVAHLLESNRKISLIFMRLPDGGLEGRGYSSTNRETLARLYNGVFSDIHSVDGNSQYSKEAVIELLTLLMKKYNPVEIRIPTANGSDSQHPDHGDHTSAGRFGLTAYERYRSGSPFAKLSQLVQYIGYPTYTWPSNVSGKALNDKKDMFYTYGQFDRSVCRSDAECQSTAYSKYIPKQYTRQ